MKKGIIVYQSKYGATKKYAQWLQDMTGFACIETPKAAINDVLPYETVVLCGGIYASGIAGLSFLKKHISRLKEQKIILLCVGASPYDESALAQIKAHNLKGRLSGLPLFYGRGAWNESKMKFMDRTLCRLLRKSVSKKAPDTCEPWMKALMCAAEQACDWTDRRYLLPLLESLKE